jgi:MGT family glycosyltransferase
MGAQSRRFLLTMWDGGGNAPPELGVARRVVERGHQVHVLGDPTLAGAAEAAGCTFSSWSRAPHRATLDVADDLVKDWEANDPLETLRGLRDRLMSGPASGFAADTTDAIAAFEPDAVVADTQMFGSIIAAQAAGLPVAVFIPNLWVIPTPETGDRAVLRLITRVVNAGLPDLNAARAEYDLPPLTAFYDQVLAADRILVLSSEAFDSASPFVPKNVRYVGPILDDPSWVQPWSSPWPEKNTDPLVLVGFTSVYQDQGPLLQRVVDALSSMKVRAVVAVGLMLKADELAGSPNVAVVQSAPHNVILRDASVVVSHCGHGTTMKTLAAGVPMVCIPMGRDQDATAERVVAEGAGVQLSPAASSSEIRLAIADVLDNAEYRRNALRLAEILAREHESFDVVLELEQLVGLFPDSALT